MNDLLMSHLATIDQRLVFYLDEDDEMMFDTVERLRAYTTDLLDGSITPAFLVEKWSDWFPLASAFALAYGTEELKRLQDDAALPRKHDEVGLTEADRAYLQALAFQLDRYPKVRTAGK
jgi:hypothetical protein